MRRRGGVARYRLGRPVTPVDRPRRDRVRARVRRRQAQRVDAALVNRRSAADRKRRRDVVDGDREAVRPEVGIVIGHGDRGRVHAVVGVQVVQCEGLVRRQGQRLDGRAIAVVHRCGPCVGARVGEGTAEGRLVLNNVPSHRVAAVKVVPVARARPEVNAVLTTRVVGLDRTPVGVGEGFAR